MERITGREVFTLRFTAPFIVFALLLTAPFGATPHAAAAVYPAASCNRSDVNAVINGPTHTAVDGDTIQIPSGSCTWSSGITVPAGKAITIAGTGTPNATAATAGASASCGSTTITLIGATAFRMTPTYGISTARLSCMKLTYGGGSSIGFLMQGTCAATGCPNARIDNLTFSNWAGHASAGISYGINAIGDVFGVVDHNTINGAAGNYLQLVELSHAKYLGSGSYGDNAWAQSESYGSANFLFIENNTFNTSGCCENEATIDSQENQGGGRVVVRFNTFAAMDNINFSMGWHGTESNGRPRGTRTFEYYGNTFTCNVHCNTVTGSRSGTGLTWGNTIDLSAGSLNVFVSLATLRTEASIGGWGACDGSSPYDTNDGKTYWSGTVGSGGGTTTITISGGSPGWSTNQWAPSGAPYSVHDITQSTGTEITANGANTLTLSYSGGPGSWLPKNGDSIQILRATSCIDQAGGRGAGILYSGSTPFPSSSANEVQSPTYLWSNTFSGGTPVFNSGNSGIVSTTARVIRSRDFYVENTNQAAQSSATSPFDGTTTVGMGHGTLANRPMTCTAGVGYWATDQGTWNQSGSGGQGQLYLCKTTNTWTAWYTPYTYPHPVINGSAPVQPPTAPSNVRIIG